MRAQSEKGGRTLFYLLFIFLAVGLGFILGGVAVYLHGGSSRPTATGGSKHLPSDKVGARGRIGPEGGIVEVGVPAPDRVAAIRVTEGKPVKKDDELVILDSKAIREGEYELLRVQLEVAKQQRAIIAASGAAQKKVEKVRRDQATEVGSLQEDAQQSKVAFLDQQLKGACEDLSRMVNARTYAKQDLEKQQLLIKQIAAEKTAAECLLKQTKAERGFTDKLAPLQETARDTELNRSLRAIPVESLEKQVEQAKQRWEDSRVLAPTSGTVLAILVHKGELVGAGRPILRLADTRHMIVTAEVYETDIGRVHVGQGATVTSHIFDPQKGHKPLAGEVVEIASTIGRSQVAALDPRATVDNRVVEVKIRLTEPDRVAKLIGHEVSVEIEAP